jgi:SagB-type dehydrogenase family enzyme
LFRELVSAHRTNGQTPLVTPGALYRRSPCIVAVWDDGRLVFENYATRKRVAAAPIACQVLDFFSDWRSLEELAEAMPQYSKRSHANAVRQLVRVTLLQCSTTRATLVEENIHLWKPWNPAAGYLHFSTKDVKYQRDAAALERYFHQIAQRLPMPSPVKRYTRAARVPMAQPAYESDFSRVLLSRRTWREFSSKPVGFNDLSTLFGLTFRIQAWLDFYNLGRLAVKTSPSGGARHPIEAYLIALNVKGLKRGVYHYASDTHELEWLSDLPGKRLLQSLTPAQDWCSQAAAMVFMTAVFGRAQWKYRFPRAYRTVLLDAGHLCQTFCLTATWLGLAPYCTMALADTKIERLLGIDGVSEGAIYLAGVGTRPAGFSPEEGFTPNSPPAASESRPKRSSKAAKRGSGRSGS